MIYVSVGQFQGFTVPTDLAFLSPFAEFRLLRESRVGVVKGAPTGPISKRVPRVKKQVRFGP
jgi:hypothetical protein